MTEFGDWVLKWNPTEPHKLWNVYGDAATLLALVEEAMDCKRGRRGSCVNYKNFPKDQWCDGCLALAACKEFQEKYQ